MTTRTPDFDTLPPWTLIDEERSTLLEEELRRELRPDHILTGARIEAVAMSTMTDDVLFLTDHANGALAHVHLTWSGKRLSEKYSNPEF